MQRGHIVKIAQCFCCCSHVLWGVNTASLPPLPFTNIKTLSCTLTDQLAFLCRDYALLFGSVGLSTTFIPSFRNMRIFSFIAILGTTFTAWYMVAEASAAGLKPNLWSQPPAQGLQAFVEGGTALIFVYGGHAMLM